MSVGHPTHREAKLALAILARSFGNGKPPKHDDPDIILFNYVNDQEDAEKRRKAPPTAPPTFA